MKSNFNNMKEAMNINPPSFYSISDSILNFKRTNKIIFDWNEILEDKPNRMGYLQNYFILNSYKDIDNNTILSSCKGHFWDFYSCTTKQGDKNLFGIKLEPSGRIYALWDNSNFIDEMAVTPLLDGSIDNLFKSINEINNLVIINPDNNGKYNFDFNPDSNYISRELLFYYEKFQNLSAKLEFITIVNNKISEDSANTTDKSFLRNLFESNEQLSKIFVDNDLLDFYISNLSRIRAIEIDLNAELNIVVRKLLERGYYLHIKRLEKTATIGKATSSVEYGKIYRVFEESKEVVTGTREEEYWVTHIDYDYTMYDKNGKAIGELNEPKIVKTKERQVRDIEVKEIQFFSTLKEVELNEDPIFNEVLRLKNEGKTVLFIENSSRGFVSNIGESLDSVIEDCFINEKKRKKTVLVFQDYESLNESKKGLIGAKFYYFPLPAIFPTQMPSIAIRETLDYRMSWNGLELGKLLSSINLAPGETKSVSVISKYSSINNITNNSKSFNEISSLDSSEITNEFEKLATNELEKSTESKSSISAGVSYGGFGASGDASQNSKETLKSFTKDLSKLTNKVTKTINKRATLEISSSSSQTTQNSTDTSRTSNISNINQGATLNLYYYQINNKFRSCLFIDDLKFIISSSTEKIQGSGIYDVTEIKIQSIEQLISIFENYLPKKYFDYKEKKIKIEIVKAVIRTLNEYTDKPLLTNENDEIEIFNNITTNSIKVLGKTVEKLNNAIDDYDKLLPLYKLFISSIAFDDLIVSEENIILDSGSYYIDSQVGVNPATEAYSERMRNLEALKVESQIENQVALTNEVKAKNQLLNSNSVYINDVSILINQDKNENLIILSLSAKIVDNNWDIYVKNFKISPLSIDLVNDGYTILIKLSTLKSNEEELKQTLILINSVSKNIIRYI